MFNLKEFVLNNLINGVKNGSFSKQYASILATNYVLKGLLSEEDVARFDEETKVEEVTIENEEVVTEEPTIEESMTENAEEPLILE